ncbi:eukaryotic aspartyl protease [Ancylostoma ceylanicum]|uniref:Eukaryotic aspartyl protease n=1 Tax=Ancylostoma ceylanicum TaxID=53326 RepID=A0A0D6LFI5_9BILA|nr:eukaryotic aspartyl protease [Ancylostoma ceylanicum]
MFAPQRILQAKAENTRENSKVAQPTSAGDSHESAGWLPNWNQSEFLEFNCTGTVPRGLQMKCLSEVERYLYWLKCKKYKKTAWQGRTKETYSPPIVSWILKHPADAHFDPGSRREKKAEEKRPWHHPTSAAKIIAAACCLRNLCIMMRERPFSAEEAKIMLQNWKSRMRVLQMTRGAMYISTFIILTIIWCAAATVYQVPLVKMEFKRDQMMRTGEWAAHVQRRNAEWSDLNAKTHSDKRFRQQDVTNYYDEEYLANISIGTPAQKFQMLLDLKSPYFWVPDYTCAPPVRPKGGRKTYDPRDSETIVETDEDFDALFGEFEASGIYSIETVIFGDDRMKHLVAEGIKFGRAKRAYGFHESAMDGVFGLGFVDPHEEDYVPALLQAAELGLVKPIFTIYLKHISGISIKNFSYNKVMHAESDTKDPFIICPAEIADAIAKEVGAQYNDTDDVYYIDCSAKPVVELRIENNKFTIGIVIPGPKVNLPHVATAKMRIAPGSLHLYTLRGNLATLRRDVSNKKVTLLLSP